MKRKRSDLAVEFAADLDENDVKLTEVVYEGIKATDVTLGSKSGKLIGRSEEHTSELQSPS